MNKEEGLGWASGGINAQKANHIRFEIVQNIIGDRIPIPQRKTPN